MGGKDPYSASKGAAELVSQSYRHSFFNPAEYGKTHNTLIANARAGNVIHVAEAASAELLDPSKTVGELVAEKIGSIKENITVRRFTRYKMGEGIEKKQDDFAAEVASMVG